MQLNISAHSARDGMEHSAICAALTALYAQELVYGLQLATGLLCGLYGSLPRHLAGLVAAKTTPTTLTTSKASVSEHRLSMPLTRAYQFWSVRTFSKLAHQPSPA